MVSGMSLVEKWTDIRRRPEIIIPAGCVRALIPVRQERVYHLVTVVYSESELIPAILLIMLYWKIKWNIMLAAAEALYLILLGFQ